MHQKLKVMFTNYPVATGFEIAWRNLVKNKVYSFINVGGIAIGIAVTMLIGLWVYDEVTFNKSHENYESVAPVRMNLKNLS